MSIRMRRLGLVGLFALLVSGLTTTAAPPGRRRGHPRVQRHARRERRLPDRHRLHVRRSHAGHGAGRAAARPHRRRGAADHPGARPQRTHLHQLGARPARRRGRPRPGTRAIYLFYTARGTSTRVPDEHHGQPRRGPPTASRGSCSATTTWSTRRARRSCSTASTRRPATTTPATCTSARTATSTSPPATAAATTRATAAAAAPTTRRATGTSSTARSCGSTAPPVHPAPGNPFLGTGSASCRLGPRPRPGRSARRRSRGGCATRSGSRSTRTRRARRSGSTTSARTSWEEIDHGHRAAPTTAGTCREGHCAQTGSATDCGAPHPAGMTDPIHDYGRADGLRLDHRRGVRAERRLAGRLRRGYLFADYVCGKIMMLAGGTRTDLATGLGGARAPGVRAVRRAARRCTTRPTRTAARSAASPTPAPPTARPSPPLTASPVDRRRAADHDAERLRQQRPRRRRAHLPVDVRRRVARRDDDAPDRRAHLRGRHVDGDPAGARPGRSACPHPSPSRSARATPRRSRRSRHRRPVPRSPSARRYRLSGSATDAAGRHPAARRGSAGRSCACTTSTPTRSSAGHRQRRRRSSRPARRTSRRPPTATCGSA